MCKIKNLLDVYAQASQTDIVLASASYHKYNALTGEVAEKYGYDRDIGAAVFAALSPNNDYFGNLRDVDRLLKGTRAGLHYDKIKVCTYGPNKIKAWRIANGERALDLIVAPKTRNFYLNVRDPLDNHPVTIDGHMLCAWRGVRTTLDNAKMNPKLYEVVATDFREAAKSLSVIPNRFQAVLWTTWRRIHGVKLTTVAQPEFWDVERLAARLDYRSNLL